ncbi:MAG: hypothetical protein M3Y27_26055, partial [Acidobacteriota bacterium]|nr:hypothetical protein [Acidobacteriota bacterium]
MVSVLGFNVIQAKAAAGSVKSIPSPISSILHWTASVYNYNPQGVDVANRKVTTGDIWVGVDSKGLPLLVHTNYSFDGGVFYQETLETPSTATEIMSSSVNGRSTCSQNFPYSQQQLSNRMPTFYSDTTLNQQHFTKSARTPA